MGETNDRAKVALEKLLTLLETEGGVPPAEWSSVRFATSQLGEALLRKNKCRLEGLRLALSGQMCLNTPPLIKRAADFAAFLEDGTEPPDVYEEARRRESVETLRRTQASNHPPHIVRVIGEYRQLNERWQALGAFLLSGAYHSLPEEERSALAEQHEVMDRYAAILMDRLNRAGVSKEELL